MNEMKEFFGYILLIIGGIFCIYPFVSWFQEPNLTYMQLFIKHGDFYIIGFIIAFVGFLMIQSDTTNY